jgi:hypothetical protein
MNLGTMLKRAEDITDTDVIVTITTCSNKSSEYVVDVSLIEYPFPPRTARIILTDEDNLGQCIVNVARQQRITMEKEAHDQQVALDKHAAHMAAYRRKQKLEDALNKPEESKVTE